MMTGRFRDLKTKDLGSFPYNSCSSLLLAACWAQFQKHVVVRGSKRDSSHKAQSGKMHRTTQEYGHTHGLARVDVSPWAASAYAACNRLFSVWHAWKMFYSWKVIQTVCGMWRGHQRVLTYLKACKRLARNIPSSKEFLKMPIYLPSRFWPLCLMLLECTSVLDLSFFVALNYLHQGGKNHFHNTY